MSDLVATAEQALRALEHKRQQLIESRAADENARREIAFRAHADGDAKARQALDKLNAASVRFDAELRSIEDAIAEAQDRLAGARTAVGKEAARSSAVAARAVLDEMRAAARGVDGALSDFVDSADELFAALDKLHQLGIQQPTANQLNSLGLRVVQTWIGTSKYQRAVELVQPSARRHMLPLVTEWAQMVEQNYIAPLLGATKQTEVA
jgi:chromosome segregation ATPase